MSTLDKVDPMSDPMSEPSRSNTLLLFDVDGTLTVPMKIMRDQEATPEMLQLLQSVRQKATIGIVGGSNFSKQQEQLGQDVLKNFDYVFSENGLVAYENEAIIHTMEFKKSMPESEINRFISFVLHYIADIDIPVKRGTFVEFRTGMLNVSPIGRNCSYEERVAFNELDKQRGIREKMVQLLKEKFADLKLRYVIGGMISLDIFPEGWDKTYCLRHVESKGFSEIHFFGDKTLPGGNDYEIFSHEKVKGHSVSGPEETIVELKRLMNL